MANFIATLFSLSAAWSDLGTDDIVGGVTSTFCNNVWDGVLPTFETLPLSAPLGKAKQLKALSKAKAVAIGRKHGDGRLIVSGTKGANVLELIEFAQRRLAVFDGSRLGG